jgi:Leucine-rich repeat (LRR) protein
MILIHFQCLYCQDTTPLIECKNEARNCVMFIKDHGNGGFAKAFPESNEQKNATYLYINGTKAESIYGGFSTRFPNVQIIVAKNTKFRKIPHEFSHGNFQHLTGLILSNNIIESLTSQCFAALSQLQRLYLDNNNLSALEEGCFDGLSELNDLNLSFNILGTISSSIFGTLAELKDLYLHNNQLTSFDASAVENNKKLSYLELQNNHIKAISGSAQILGVKIINLSNNSLVDVTGLKSFLNIQVLYLSSNSELKLPENSFNGLTKIWMLYLDDVNLSTVQNLHNLFSPLTSLYQLNITKNNLKSLSFEKFQKKIYLYNLFFDSNNLTEINIEEMKKVFPNLNRISIDKNDWNCSYLNVTIQTLQQQNITFNAGTSDEPNIKGISCISKNIWTTTSFTLHVPYILILFSILALLNIAVSIFFLTKNY